MVELNKSQILTIEKFVSYPTGFGYVLTLSDRTFLDFFKTKWQIDIEDKRYRDLGMSKRNRLISFCLQHDSILVAKVLHDLLGQSQLIGNKNTKSPPDDLQQEFRKIIEKLWNESKSDSQPLYDDYESTQELPSSHSTKEVSRKIVARNIKANAVPLTLTAASIIAQIVDYREQVRIDNQLGASNPEFRDNLLAFLDGLTTDIEILLNQIPAPNTTPTPNQEEAATDWADRFINSAIPEWNKYISAENLGKTAAPIGIIFGCGALGFLLSGLNPIGLGAGGFVGKLITGELKSGAASDKIAEQFSAESEEE